MLYTAHIIENSGAGRKAKQSPSVAFLVTPLSLLVGWKRERGSNQGGDEATDCNHMALTALGGENRSRVGGFLMQRAVCLSPSTHLDVNRIPLSGRCP